MSISVEGSFSRAVSDDEQHTMTTKNEVEYVGHFNIDNAEETLILLLEFALVEDLHGDHRRILDRPARSSQ